MAWHLKGHVQKESRIISIREEDWGIDVNSNVIAQPGTQFDIEVNSHKERTIAAIDNEGKVDVYGNVSPVGFYDSFPTGEQISYISAASHDGVISLPAANNDPSSADMFSTYLDYPIGGDLSVGNQGPDPSYWGSWFFFPNMQIPTGGELSYMYLEFDAWSLSAGRQINTGMHVAWYDDVRLPTNLTEWSQLNWHSGWWKWDFTSVTGGVKQESNRTLRDVVQYVIDRPGWNFGNSLLICIVPRTPSGGSPPGTGTYQGWYQYERVWEYWPDSRPRLIYKVDPNLHL